jgi:predicted lipid-binding transport protein (Tim44 family)|tara:strand:+ start:439 stop:705 length:267 start_codon:yes stop_codon:yes gene_type:complete
MSKLKVFMSESWYTYRRSHSIEIDTDDYEELKGMTDEEAYEYLSENIWDFEMKKEKGDKYSMTLAEELQEDWVREKIKNEEITLEREE